MIDGWEAVNGKPGGQMRCAGCGAYMEATRYKQTGQKAEYCALTCGIVSVAELNGDNSYYGYVPKVV